MADAFAHDDLQAGVPALADLIRRLPPEPPAAAGGRILVACADVLEASGVQRPEAVNLALVLLGGSAPKEAGSR